MLSGLSKSTLAYCKGHALVQVILVLLDVTAEEEAAPVGDAEVHKAALLKLGISCSKLA